MNANQHRESVNRLRKTIFDLKQRIVRLEGLMGISANDDDKRYGEKKDKGELFKTIGIGDIVLSGRDMDKRSRFALRRNPDAPGKVEDKNGDIYYVRWTAKEAYWYRYDRKVRRIKLYSKS